MPIKRCTCIHKEQDEMYGRGNRVHNIRGNGAFCRCTVCNSEKSLEKGEITSDKKGTKKK